MTPAGTFANSKEPQDKAHLLNCVLEMPTVKSMRGSFAGCFGLCAALLAGVLAWFGRQRW